MEKRTQTRRHTIAPMRVYNAVSGELTGRVENITVDGMKMISTQSLEPGRMYTLRMDLPDSLPERQTMIVRCQTVWCRNDDPFGMHDIGLKFIDLEVRDRDIIDRPLTHYLFPD